jgi:hypothetical protein
LWPPPISRRRPAIACFSLRAAQNLARARAALQTQAQWLLRNSAVLVTLLGHADNHGDDDFVLSEHGAEAMRQRLPPQITVLVFGRSQSFGNGADAVCAEQTRGVSLIALPQPATAADYELALNWRSGVRKPHDDHGGGYFEMRLAEGAKSC